MSEVNNTVKTTYIVETRAAQREVAALAAAQTRHGKEAARAMDLFQREATAALGKVEKSVAAQEKAWNKAQGGIAAYDKALKESIKTTEKASSAWGSATERWKSIARTVGDVGLAFNTVKQGIDIATKALEASAKAASIAAAAWREYRRDSAQQASADTSETYRARVMDRIGYVPDSLFTKIYGSNVSSAEMTQAIDEYMKTHGRGADVLAAEKAKFEGQKYNSPSEIKYRAEQEFIRGLNAEAEKKRKEQEERDRRGGGRAGRIGRTADDDYRLMMAGSQAMQKLSIWVDSLPGIDQRVADVLGPDYGGDPNAGLVFNDGAIGSGLSDELTKFVNTAKVAPTEKGNALLERVFGPREDFDFYATALGTLRDATTEVYTALVTGSESAGAALKRVVGTAIMAEGSRMAVEALKEGAYAIAALAQGNLPSAALHGKAAAGFLAGSVAAGVAASALGAGGGSTSAGASAGPSTIGPGGSSVFGAGMDRDARTTIVLGNGWEDESPRERSQRIARAMERAGQYRRPTEGVTWE